MNASQTRSQSYRATDIAREAVIAEAGEAALGAFLKRHEVDETVFDYVFAARLPGYRGWHWSVMVVELTEDANPTINGVYLLPGERALRTPTWVPWSTRVRPGDHGVAELLPEADADLRLVPGYVADASDEWWGTSTAFWWQVGLGRKHMLSVAGRDQLVERWYASSRGPDVNREEPLTDSDFRCSTCAFFIPLSGAVGSVFGGCVNVFSHDEGTVVSFDHGCLAHSEVPRVSASVAVAEPFLDEFGYDSVAAFEGDEDAEVSDENSEDSDPEPPDSLGFDQPGPEEEHRGERGDPNESSDHSDSAI